MLQFTAPFPLADQGPSSFNSGPLNPSQQWGPSMWYSPCAARCILSDETEPTTAKITNHSPAIFSQEGHHLITLLKLCVTEAILCVCKHSTPSLQPLQPPTAQTWGVFFTLTHWDPRLIRVHSTQRAAMTRFQKMRLLWLETIMKACVKQRPDVCSAHSKYCLEQSPGLFWFCFLNKTGLTESPL